MPVLHWCVPRTFQPGLMLAHCPAGLNQGHCLASLTRTLTLRLLVPVHQTHTHKRANTHADTHKAHSPLERWAEVVTVITDPHSSHPPPTQRVRERQKLRSGIIPNVECVSVHSHPTHGIPGDDGGMKRAQSLHTHTHIHNTLLMHPAPALGLKALHDLLNKRLEQQVKGGTVRSVTNVVLYVHTDV